MNNSPASAWLSQVDGARSAADLARILRDYLNALTPEHRDALPAGCRPENLTTAAEIQEWAVTLAHQDLRTREPMNGTDVLHQAAVLFAAAGTKLPKVAE